MSYVHSYRNGKAWVRGSAAGFFLLSILFPLQYFPFFFTCACSLYPFFVRAWVTLTATTVVYTATHHALHHQQHLFHRHYHRQKTIGYYVPCILVENKTAKLSPFLYLCIFKGNAVNGNKTSSAFTRSHTHHQSYTLFHPSSLT